MSAAGVLVVVGDGVAGAVVAAGVAGGVVVGSDGVVLASVVVADAEVADAEVADAEAVGGVVVSEEVVDAEAVNGVVVSEEVVDAESVNGVVGAVVDGPLEVLGAASPVGLGPQPLSERAAMASPAARLAHVFTCPLHGAAGRHDGRRGIGHLPRRR